MTGRPVAVRSSLDDLMDLLSTAWTKTVASPSDTPKTTLAASIRVFLGAAGPCGISARRINLASGRWYSLCALVSLNRDRKFS